MLHVHVITACTKLTYKAIYTGADPEVGKGNLLLLIFRCLVCMKVVDDSFTAAFKLV